MPNYPAQIDNSISIPPVVDNFSGVTATSYNKLREAILAIEQELGTAPKGVYSTVKSRLDALENTISRLTGGGFMYWTLTAGDESTSFNGWQTIGAANIEPYPTSFTDYTFEAVVECSSGRTCYIRVLNFTDNIELTDTVLSSTSTTPTILSTPLTVDSSTGFVSSEKLYLMQIKMDITDPGQYVTCKSAIIKSTI